MVECNNWNDHRNESLAMLKSNAHMQIKCLFYRSFWTHRITAHFFSSSYAWKQIKHFFVGLDSILSFFVRLVYLFSCLKMTTKTPLDLMRSFFFLFLDDHINIVWQSKNEHEKTTKSGCFSIAKKQLWGNGHKQKIIVRYLFLTA